MELLQKRFFNQTKLNSSSVKRHSFYKRMSAISQRQSLDVTTLFKRANLINLPFQKKGEAGFITILLLPFLSLLLIALMSFTVLSTGIKNITRTQSLCIQQALQTQKELGNILSQLLKLNKQVSGLSKSRKTAEISIKTAIASIFLIPKVPYLKKIRDAIKLSQKILIARQQSLLSKSFFIKRRALAQLKQKFKKLKAKQVKELSLYKKALAVKKEKIGSDAYIYRPVEDFKNHQKISYQWRISIFQPLEKSWLLFKDYNSKYSCTSSLELRGSKWQNILYH